MTWNLFEGMPYVAVWAKVDGILSNREAGSEFARARAGVERRMFAEHHPTEQEVGSPCVACGEAWPCGIITSIAAPD